MVSVLGNWMYIFFTAYAMGFAFSKYVEGRLGYRIKGTGSTVSAGIVTATVYAQFFSLIYKVGFLANLIMLLICLAVCVVWHREMGKQWRDALTGSSRTGKAQTLALVLIWAYCTSRGYMHYDSDLYHAQSIRWIEEYGIVKGLGNIHVRFAYNSSFFALSALYSMKFLLGQSLHTVNGLIALLLSLETLKLTEAVKRRKVRLSDFARLGALYYLTVIYSDIVSPASDYAIMCVVFFIIIKWLVLLEESVDEAAPYALLCVAGVYAVTLKLTAGLLLLLLAKPLYMLVSGRKWRDTAVYLLMGIVTVVPWLARTVVISGYLLYPFPALDLFDVDWKMDAAAAALDAAEIRTWGRGLNNAALAGLPVSEWIAGWFWNTLPATGKLLILADAVCIVIFAVLVVRCVSGGMDRLLTAQLPVLATVIVSYGFWQLSAPLIRYGYAYILLTVSITAGILWDLLIKHFQNKQKEYMIKGVSVLGMAALSVFLAVKALSLAGYLRAESEKAAYVWQQDYGRYGLESYEVQGTVFYYPVSGDRTGYDSFPSLPRQTRIYFRGESIREGFRKGMGTNDEK